MAVSPIAASTLPGADPIPDEVITAFNDLITQNFVGDRAFVRSSQIKSHLENNGYSAFQRSMLNGALLFKDQGWTVNITELEGDVRFEFAKAP